VNKLLILLFLTISCSSKLDKEKRKQIIFDIASKLEKPGENYHSSLPDKASLLIRKKRQK